MVVGSILGDPFWKDYVQIKSKGKTKIISILHMSSINSPTEIIWTSTKLHTTSPLLYISWELRWYLKVGNKESNDFRSVWNEKAWWWEKTIKLITRVGTGGKYKRDRDGFKPMFSLNPNWHELWNQEKCSSLVPPRSIFYNKQWAWQGIKLTRLMSIFISKHFGNFW